jgi:hypothetical protein
MSELFGMRRANGDWFALSDNGNLRMTVFLSVAEAMLARSRNTEMECFRPAVLDKRAIESLEMSESETVCFSLVSDASRNLRRGRAIGLDELTNFNAALKESEEVKVVST